MPGTVDLVWVSGFPATTYSGNETRHGDQVPTHIEYSASCQRLVEQPVILIMADADAE
jgi:hypothetical protein